jgi:hypothetical protein
LREEEFRRWFEDQVYAASTISTQISDARSVEQPNGDLDKLYEQDELSRLTAELTYSAADRTSGTPNPTKLTLWGDAYRDLGHLRSTLSH